MIDNDEKALALLMMLRERAKHDADPVLVAKRQQVSRRALRAAQRRRK